MKQVQPTQIRYSESFKRKVVSEIESGKYNQTQAAKMYGIKGDGTVRSWIKKLGKNELLAKKVRIEMVDETSKLKKLEAENKKLKEALADSYMENMLYKNLIIAADKYFDTDIKKNFGQKVSPGAEGNHVETK